MEIAGTQENNLLKRKGESADGQAHEEKIDDVELPVRVKNVLHWNNVRSLKRLASLTEGQLRHFRDGKGNSLGVRSLSHIKDVLAKRGLRLALSSRERYFYAIDNTELSTRAKNILRNQNVRNIEELASLTESEVFRMRGMGGKVLEEIKDVLAKRGLSLVEEEKFPLDSENLPGWTKYHLSHYKVKSLDELTVLTEEQLGKIPFLGKSSIAQIKIALANQGLSLAEKADYELQKSSEHLIVKIAFEETFGRAKTSGLPEAAAQTAKSEPVTCGNFQRKLAELAGKDVIHAAQALLDKMDNKELDKFKKICEANGAKSAESLNDFFVGLMNGTKRFELKPKGRKGPDKDEGRGV